MAGIFYVIAVTRGWNGYLNRSQHRKLTVEKRNFVDSNLQPFDRESGALTTELSPLPIRGKRKGGGGGDPEITLDYLYDVLFKTQLEPSARSCHAPVKKPMILTPSPVHPSRSATNVIPQA